jgi:hypothetical protein
MTKEKANLIGAIVGISIVGITAIIMTIFITSTPQINDEQKAANGRYWQCLSDEKEMSTVTSNNSDSYHSFSPQDCNGALIENQKTNNQ